MENENSAKKRWSSKDTKYSPMIPDTMEIPQRNSRRTKSMKMIPAKDAMFDGLLGRIVKEIAPETEANPVAILASYIATTSAMLDKPYLNLTGNVKLNTNLPFVLVGVTSHGRKGTATRLATDAFEIMTPDWFKEHKLKSIKTPEGLINKFADGEIIEDEDDEYDDNPLDSKKEPLYIRNNALPPKQPYLTDKPISEDTPEYKNRGVLADDKRAFWIETEFSKTLKWMTKKEETLEDVFMQVFDKESLATVTKYNSASSDPVHISMMAHITPKKLLRLMSPEKLEDGFANRILWVWTYRVRKQEKPTVIDLKPRAMDLISHIEKVKDTGEMNFDDEAQEYYFKTIKQKYDLGGEGAMEVLSRAEILIPKLAMMYALMDEFKSSYTITYNHLKSAEAFWEYCEASCYRIFNLDELEDMDDNKDLQTIIEHLRATGEPMTKDEINKFFSGHLDGDRGKKFGESIKDSELITITKESTSGRPKEIYSLTEWIPKIEEWTIKNGGN